MCAAATRRGKIREIFNRQLSRDRSWNRIIFVVQEPQRDAYPAPALAPNLMLFNAGGT
jgi:hypothetical protein